MNAVRTLLSPFLVMLLLTLVLLLCTTATLRASTPNTTLARHEVLKSLSAGALDESLYSVTRPRCELDLVASRFSHGDQVSASWRIFNPAPTRVNVEIKIWFTVPGQPPYSIANSLDNGRPVSLPASLDQTTHMTELFTVDDSTTRGIYEISCRLIDPITGNMFSEDLNDFQVR